MKFSKEMRDTVKKYLKQSEERKKKMDKVRKIDYCKFDEPINM